MYHEWSVLAGRPALCVDFEDKISLTRRGRNSGFIFGYSLRSMHIAMLFTPAAFSKLDILIAYI
jgi:hypothetical protein